MLRAIFFNLPTLDKTILYGRIHGKVTTMNPQPEPYVGTIFAIIFVIALVVYTIKGYYNKDNKISDKYIIGYVDDYFEPIPVIPNRPKVRRTTVSKPKQKVATPTTKPVTTPPPSTQVAAQPVKPQRDEALYNDCIGCLVALGYKKTEAKNKTSDIFDNHEITTIEQFIKLVTVNTITL